MKRECDPPMTARPRIPLRAAAVIPVAAYAVRSAVRGSAAPDLPDDAIVFGALLCVLALGAFAGTSAQRRRDILADQMHDRDEHHDTERQSDEVGADVQRPDAGSPGSADDGQPPTECNTDPGTKAPGKCPEERLR